MTWRIYEERGLRFACRSLIYVSSCNEVQTRRFRSVEFLLGLCDSVHAALMMMSETGLTTDPASMLAMLTVGVSVRSPLLTVSLKAQLAAMLCRICSALTLSSPSTAEIADEDSFCVVSLITLQC